MVNQVYLLSDHWKALRQERLKKDQFQCQCCGTKYHLQVHHLRYRNIYDVLVEDLKTLCRTCHKAEHFGPKLIKAKRSKPYKKSKKASSIQNALYRSIKSIVRDNNRSFYERMEIIKKAFGDVPFPRHMKTKLARYKKHSPP